MKDEWLRLKKIISGGQTGADQAGLRAGKFLGLETGGWMPKGFRTDDGPRPEFAELYGMQETVSKDYPARTRLNVRDSQGTLVFGKPSSGSNLTVDFCHEHKRSVIVLPYPEMSLSRDNVMTMLRHWLHGEWGDHQPHPITILNIAGNREKKNPGIGDYTYNFLVELGEKNAV